MDNLLTIQARRTRSDFALDQRGSTACLVTAICVLLATLFLTFPLAAIGESVVNEPGVWQDLFDGRTTDGWNAVGDAQWRVQDGRLSSVPESGDGMLVFNTAFGDFTLEVEFRIDEDVNSGVFIRCQEPDTITPQSCYEFNIWDEHPDPLYRTGAIVTIQPPQAIVETVGNWNTYVIRARGSRLSAHLNGISVANLCTAELGAGHIALQRFGSGTVEFRIVRIRFP